MARLILALVSVLLITTPSLGQQSLIGTYKLVSHDVEVDGSMTYPQGNSPHGYLMLTPTHMVYFMTAANRKFGTSVDDKAALLDTLSAFSGSYRVEGNKLFVKGDASWLENWTGRDQIRTWELSGNRLTLTISGQHPREPSKTATGRQVWELIPTPSLGQQSLVATYKLVSLEARVEGTLYEPMGKAPHGYLVITPTHFIYFITSESRTFGTSVNEKAALLDSMVAWAGTYRVEGDKFIQNMEISFTEGEKEKTRVATMEPSGSRLTFRTGRIPFPRDPSKTMINVQVWEKVE